MHFNVNPRICVSPLHLPSLDLHLVESEINHLLLKLPVLGLLLKPALPVLTISPRCLALHLPQALSQKLVVGHQTRGLLDLAVDMISATKGVLEAMDPGAAESLDPATSLLWGVGSKEVGVGARDNPKAGIGLELDSQMSQDSSVND